MRCSLLREECNIWRMEGGSCILGKTFWSVEGSDSGLEAYVEQNNRKKQLKFYTVRTNMIFSHIVACHIGWSFYNTGGKCYKFFSASVRWSQALTLCQEAAPNDSGDLASITSQDNQEFVEMKILNIQKSTV